MERRDALMFARCRGVWILLAVLLSASIGQADEGCLVQQIYAVSDVVLRTDQESEPKACDEQLIKNITDTIAPRSWSSKGGRGTIDYHPLTMSLVVNQTAEIQEQIADLLAALRRRQEMQVSVEVKFVHIDQSVLEKLKQQGLFKESKGKDVSSLDKGQMIRFMQEAQSDIHCKLLQSPQLAMRNGQTAVRNSGEELHCVTGLEIVSRNGQIDYVPKKETIPLGPQIRIRSHISTDRRRVRVSVDAKVNKLDSPKVPRFRITTPDPDGESGTVTHFIETPKISTYGVKRTMVIPDGNTAVLIGGTFHCVQATVSKVPTLGDVPYLGRLFRTVAYEELQQYCLVLVTPRILVPQEKEEKQPHEAANSNSVHPCRCEDFRTPILGPYPPQVPQCHEAPAEARILRALPPLRRLAGVIEESRDNVQIVTERIVDKVDPPRFFPLVGSAQLHHCGWKCSVYYQETISGSYPFCFRWTQPRIDVVYIDTDHLHLVPTDEARVK